MDIRNITKHIDFNSSLTCNIQLVVSYSRGGARDFSTERLNLQTRGLKHEFQGIINNKNLRKHRL